MTSLSTRGQRALMQTSVDVITHGQHASGAYVAAPSYSPYAYAWLRDGAFCAYAMELRGHADSARAFHTFVTRTVLRHRRLFQSADPGSGEVPPTRFTLDGRLEDDPAGQVWPSNFQLDGYGTWLWMLRDHARRGGNLTDDDRTAAKLVSRYLQRMATVPCFDCWEEFGTRRHTSTVASVVAGLQAASDVVEDETPGQAADSLKDRLLERHVSRDSFVKFEGSDAVDASLLWLALPFRIVEPDDQQMRLTAERISGELVGPAGGVRRYLGDTFYGGGEWILLTAWIAWYCLETGRREDAMRHLAWIESTATREGLLPEQCTRGAQFPEKVRYWEEKWGPPATPLLWSHAMYLVLRTVLED